MNMKMKYTSLAVAIASVAQSVTAFAPTRQKASNMALAAFFQAPPTPPATTISVTVPSTTMTISEASASKEAVMLFTKELSLEKEEKALEKEVKEVEKESRKDAKVRARPVLLCFNPFPPFVVHPNSLPPTFVSILLVKGC